jgi:hypothetical protein
MRTSLDTKNAIKRPIEQRTEELVGLLLRSSISYASKTRRTSGAALRSNQVSVKMTRRIDIQLGNIDS